MDAVARKLKMRALPAAATSALGFAAAPSLQIPYFDLDGRQTSFYRIRYLASLPGFAGQEAKPQRYAQPKGTMNEAYLPPPRATSWRKIAESDTPLYVTEGELKATAGGAFGFPVVGLGGVDVWRSAKRGLDMLPILEKFNWARPVYIIYDSDLTDNLNVIRAQGQLARALLDRGAQVELITLPAAKDGGKQGLDDFLVAHRDDAKEALNDLVENALPFAESSALWALNAEVLLIPKTGIVVERATGDFINTDRFERVTHANRHYQETVVKGKSLTLVKQPLAKRWIGWEHRAEMERVVYEPGKPRELPGRQWNMWSGWGVRPERGDVGPWKWLMDFLFKDDHKMRMWFERWCAYPMQHPGTKMYTAMLLWSRAKRMGKGLAAYSLMSIYGDTNSVEINNKSIKSDFNTWAKNRQFVYASEIRGSEAKIDSDWLKSVITNPTVTINEKYLPQYTTRNLTNFLFDSNHPDALFLEDGDQRYAVHEIPGKPAERAKYEVYDKWLHGKGPSYLFYHLLHLRLGGFNPREHAPDTIGKRNMINHGRSDLGVWVHLLDLDPTQALRPLGENVAKNCDLYTPRLLYRAFDPEGKRYSGESGLGRALSGGGFHQLHGDTPVRTTLGLSRIYAVRNREKWEQATKKEVIEHFDKFWALDAPGRKL